MTFMWYVEVLGVDRLKREVRLWIMRDYEGIPLPRSYAFFGQLLGELWHDSGMYDRWAHEQAGHLPKPPTDADAIPPGLTDNAAVDFIEHVEMLRWCGSSEAIEDVDMEAEDDVEDEVDVEDEDNDNNNALMLQAEYVVRVTDQRYISCRADPSFLGNFFFQSRIHIGDEEWDTWNDATANDIALGPHQDELIRPLEQFMISEQESLAITRYAVQHLATMEQLVAAIPRICRDDPTTFTPEIFPQLSSDQQQRIVSILALAKREGTVFNMLSDGAFMWFDIFSFLPLRNERRPIELRLTYLSVDPYTDEHHQDSFVMFHTGSEVAMKHYGTRGILEKIASMAARIEEDLRNNNNTEDDSDTAVHQQQVQHDRALEYGHELEQVFDALDRLTLNTNLICPIRDPTEWMRKRLHSFRHRDSLAGFLDHIVHVPPRDLAGLSFTEQNRLRWSWL